MGFTRSRIISERDERRQSRRCVGFFPIASVRPTSSIRFVRAIRSTEMSAIRGNTSRLKSMSASDPSSVYARIEIASPSRSVTRTLRATIWPQTKL